MGIKNLVPVKVEHIESTEAVEGQWTLLDRNSGQAHHLNPTASVIWELCDGVNTTGTIAESLQDIFEIDAGTASRDAESALLHLNGIGVLEFETSSPERLS